MPFFSRLGSGFASISRVVTLSGEAVAGRCSCCTLVVVRGLCPVFVGVVKDLNHREKSLMPFCPFVYVVVLIGGVDGW